MSRTLIRLDDNLEAVMGCLRSALESEGFHIRENGDVPKGIWRKLTGRHKNSRVIVACNPLPGNLADLSEADSEMFQPCTLVVAKNPAGGVTVRFPEPSVQLAAVSNPRMIDLVADTVEKFQRVRSRLVPEDDQ